MRGVRVANISLTAKPDDEISEAWVLLRKVAMWWIIGLVATMLGLYFILGYILEPLISFATGIRELEGGHYEVRLPDPGVRELAPVATTSICSLRRLRRQGRQFATLPATYRSPGRRAPANRRRPP